MKFNDTLTEFVRLDLEIGAVPALLGEPGIGKSSFVEGLARNMDTKAFVLPCNQLADKADLTGARLVPYQKADGSDSYKQVFYPHDVVQAAIDYANDNPGEWPILFFDEINRTTPDVTSAILTMITLRRLGREDLPKNLRIVVAGNDKGNVVALDDASVSRFAIYRVEPEAQTLIQILGDAINPHVRAVLTRFPHLVFEKSRPASIMSDGTDDDDDTTATYSDLLDSGEEMLQLTTPRTIEGISNWLNTVSDEKIKEYMATTVVNGEGRESTLLAEAIEAHVGDTEFATHLLNEVASAASSGNVSQAARLSAPKPNAFDTLKAARTVDELEDLISSLTEHERSGCLLYSIFDNSDNTLLVGQLAQQVNSLERDHNTVFVQLLANSQVNDRNLDAFVNSGTTSGTMAKSLVDALVG